MWCRTQAHLVGDLRVGQAQGAQGGRACDQCQERLRASLVSHHLELWRWVHGFGGVGFGVKASGSLGVSGLGSSVWGLRFGGGIWGFGFWILDFGVI